MLHEDVDSRCGTLHPTRYDAAAAVRTRHCSSVTQRAHGCRLLLALANTQLRPLTGSKHLSTDSRSLQGSKKGCMDGLGGARLRQHRGRGAYAVNAMATKRSVWVRNLACLRSCSMQMCWETDGNGACHGSVNERQTPFRPPTYGGLRRPLAAWIHRGGLQCNTQQA